MYKHIKHLRWCKIASSGWRKRRRFNLERFTHSLNLVPFILCVLNVVVLVSLVRYVYMSTGLYFQSITESGHFHWTTVHTYLTSKSTLDANFLSNGEKERIKVHRFTVERSSDR